MVSAESLMLSVSWPCGFWMFRVARMAWTLPALPTLIVSFPPLVLRLVVLSTPSTLTVSAADPVAMLTLLMSIVVVADRPRCQPGDRAPVVAVRDERESASRSAPSVSAESSTWTDVKPPGFSMDRAPRMPWTLPALPTLTVSLPPELIRLVMTPVPCTLTVSSAEAGRDGHAGRVAVLVVDRGRGQAGDRAPVGAARGERAQGHGPRRGVERVVDVDRVEAGRVLDGQCAEDALDAAGVAHVDRVVPAAGAQAGRARRWRGR